MAKSFIKLASGLFLSTATLSVSFAEEQKFDHRLEAAAMAVAASKIGEIRNTIDYKQVPEALLQVNSEQEFKRVEKKEWVEPRPRKTGPQRISSLEPNLDYIKTHSVEDLTKKKAITITWQKFDRYGRPLDFLH